MTRQGNSIPTVIQNKFKTPTGVPPKATHKAPTISGTLVAGVVVTTQGQPAIPIPGLSSSSTTVTTAVMTVTASSSTATGRPKPNLPEDEAERAQQMEVEQSLNTTLFHFRSLQVL